MNAEPHESTGPEIRRRAHPLGPLVYRYRPLNAGHGRWWAVGVLVACLGVLALAAVLEPDPRGVGTHRKLGLEPCGMLRMTGVPCPTCGMTTAFAHTVRGRLVAGVHAQPFGTLLALGVMVVIGVAIDTLATGHRWALNWFRIRPTRFVIVLGTLMLAAWVYKIVSYVGLERVWSP